MTSLIVYGVIGLIVVASVFGAIRSHDNGIRKDQKAKDEVLLIACQANEATVTAANQSLQASVKTIGDERDKQSAEVLAWKGLADRAAAVAADNLKANQSVLVQLAATQRDARAKAGRPAQKMTCEQTLAEIDSDSRTFAQEREARARDALGLPAKPDAVRVK